MCVGRHYRCCVLYPCGVGVCSLLAVCMLVGMVVFIELCAVGFLVVDESPSVLL